jgi:muramoyltetrapeptide carboxypeptidase
MKQQNLKHARIHKKKLIPTELQKGDTIGIVSPAWWLEAEKLETAATILEDMGFPVLIHPQNYRRKYQFAGRDWERKTAIEELFATPDVKAIMCARGGYGSLRIMDFLDYDMIRENPKIFVGYSDITALLISIYQHTGLITFHGAMLTDFCRENAAFSERFVDFQLSDILESEWGKRIKILRSGKFEGELIGGNLCILTNLIGTATDFETQGKILFIEDYDEPLYNIERMMIHLKRSGKLANLSGLIIGQFSQIEIHKNWGKSVDETIFDVCKEYDFPILSNFPCGHEINQVNLPIGLEVFHGVAV